MLTIGYDESRRSHTVIYLGDGQINEECLILQIHSPRMYVSGHETVAVAKPGQSLGKLHKKESSVVSDWMWLDESAQEAAISKKVRGLIALVSPVNLKKVVGLGNIMHGNYHVVFVESCFCLQVADAFELDDSIASIDIVNSSALMETDTSHENGDRALLLDSAAATSMSAPSYQAITK
jgi:hypothetical protein